MVEVVSEYLALSSEPFFKVGFADERLMLNDVKCTGL